MPKETNKVQYQSISPEILTRMQSAVAKSFGSDVLYALTSGSVVYGGGILGQSDLDLLVVLNDDVNDKGKEKLMEDIKLFVDDYLLLHKDFSFAPDITFPGEYASVAQVSDAILGRGYHTENEGELFLPVASEEYYMEDAERWYRAWLSMSAYGKFVSGNEEEFIKYKSTAWETQILFNCKKLNTSITPNGIIDMLINQKNKWAGSGISTRYFTFRKTELPHVQKALINLQDKGFFEQNLNEFVPNHDKIQQWHLITSRAILDRTIRTANFIINYDDVAEISSYAQKKWAEVNKI